MQQGRTHQKGPRCAGWTVSQNSSRLCREEDSSFACLWATLQDRNALVCYLQNKPQSGFLLKGSFMLGLEENRKEKKKKSMESREKQGYGGNVLSCRSASPHSAVLAFSCPLFLPCLSSSLVSAGTGWQRGSAAASGCGRAHRTSRPKDQ